MKMRHAALLAGFFALLAQPAAALNFLTEDNPPLNFVHQGKLIGLAPATIDEMAKRAGITASTRVLAWKDAYAATLADSDTCIYSAVRTTERFKWFQWVGPVTRGFYSAFVLPDFPEKIAKVDDLKKYRVGVMNDARADYLRQRGFMILVPFDRDQDIPKKLTLDRKAIGQVDVWVTQGYMAPFIARNEGVPALREAFSSIMSQDYFLACNLGVPQEQVKAMNDALAAMRKDGTHERLFKEAIDALKQLR